MKNQLMLNDVLRDGSGNTGRVIAISDDEFIVRSDTGEWDGDTKPVPITSEWMIIADEVCEKNSLHIDFSRKYKLKISIMNGDKVVISYFYPMPQYVHELQHILRNFNMIEI